MTTPHDADDREWISIRGMDRRFFTTPYIGASFGRYWRVSWGIGPFFGSFGYVEQF